MMSLKSRLFKHKRALIALMAISLFTISIGIAAFLSSQTPNTNYFPTPLLNNPQNNNNINAKDSYLLEWGYRKLHTIVGSTAGAQTNYQMRIVVHYGSGADSGENVYCNNKCRADFGDIRFTKSDGTTPLDYWIENEYDGDNATFWVKIDSIPASPSTATIYVYYGKSDATTTSDGDNTFIFFDDFSGTSVNGTKWNQYTEPDTIGLLSVSNSELDVKVTSGTGAVGIYALDSITQSRCVIETKAKGVYDGGSASVQSPKMSITNAPGGQTYSYAYENCFFGTDSIAHSWYTGYWSGESYYSTTQPTTYKIFQIIKNGDTFTAKYLNPDYSEIASSNSKTVSDFSFYISMWTVRPSECKYDWVRARNYASPEPTHGIWGNQEYPHLWLSGWAYCKPHMIVGSSAGEQTNYQMRITVHYGSGTDSGENVYCNAHCRYDFGDVRFTNSDGTSLLNYWMESKTDGDKATFWVEIDSIPASPSTINIYIYYGKSDAGTTSNGGSTFILFDHFDDASVDPMWTEQGSVTESGTAIMVKGGDNGNPILSSVRTAASTNLEGVCIANWVRVVPGAPQHGYNFLKTDSTTDESNYDNGWRDICIDDYKNPNYIIAHEKFGYSDTYTSTIPQDDGVWHKFEIIRKTAGTEWIIDGTSYKTSSNDPDVNEYLFILRVGNLGSNYQVECDWVYERKYVSPEPTHDSWGNEECNAALIFTREFESGNQEWNAFAELGVELSLDLNNSVSLNMSRMVGGVGGGAPSGLAFLECFVSISVNDSSALQGISITIHYSDSKVAELGLNENSLKIWYWNETSLNWIQLPSIVDPINNTVTAYTTHLTNFAILGTLIPQGALLPYILLTLFFLLMPSGLNPLIYLVLGLVAVAVVTVAGLGLRRRREEQVPEAEVPTRHARAQTPPRSGEEASGQRMVLEVRRAMPEYEMRLITVTKRAKTPKTKLRAQDLEARRTALKELMAEINARFEAGKLNPNEYREIYQKYSAKLTSVEKKLGRITTPNPTLGQRCCMFCGTEITGDAKFCPSCGGARLKCPVCQINIISGDQLLKCPHCGALSHREHLIEWVKVKGTCPSCKKKLSESESLEIL